MFKEHLWTFSPIFLSSQSAPPSCDTDVTLTGRSGRIRSTRFVCSTITENISKEEANKSGWFAHLSLINKQNKTNFLGGCEQWRSRWATSRLWLRRAEIEEKMRFLPRRAFRGTLDDLFTRYWIDIVFWQICSVAVYKFTLQRISRWSQNPLKAICHVTASSNCKATRCYSSTPLLSVQSEERPPHAPCPDLHLIGHNPPVSGFMPAICPDPGQSVASIHPAAAPLKRKKKLMRQ